MADKKDWREKYKEKNSTGKESTTSNWRDKYKEYYDYASAKIVGEQVTSMLKDWQKNYNSYVTDYTNRFSKRKGSYEDAYVGDSLEWLNAETKKQSALKKQEDDILAYLNQYGGHLDSKWVKQVFDYINQAKDAQYKIHTGATQDNEYWSSFGTEDMLKKYGSAQGAYEYYQRADGYEKKYAGLNAEDLKWASGFLDDGEEKEWLNSYTAKKEYDSKAQYDVAAGEAEIKEMEDYALWAINKLKPYSGYQAEYSKKAKELFGKYGVSNAQEMKDLIDKKKKYIADSSRIQNNIAMSSVGDPTSEHYDHEFKKYADPNAVYVLDLKNIDVYNEMNEKERATLSYYYNKYGAEKANEYANSIMDSLNYRKAEKDYSNYEGKLLLEQVFAVYAGLDQAYTGMENLFSNKDYIPTSSTQYLSGMIRDDLKDDGFKLPNWMGGASSAQVVYDLLNTSANMAPSMLVGAAANVVVPGSGALVGAAMMGGSAAGNAYQEALNAGYDKGQARMYSTLVGASEAGLQYLMGGIGKLGGKLSGKAATTLASKFNSAYARLAVQYGTNILSEGAEEYLQEILTPVFKNLAFGTDEEIELLTEEAIYSFLLGALTSGFMETSGISSDTGKSLPGHLIEISALNKKNKQAAEMYGDFTADLVKEGLDSDSESEAHELAEMFQRKLDNGKKMSGYEIRQQIAANDDIARINNKLDATNEAAKRLKELGETSDVGKIASLVAKNAMGQKLTRDETSTLVRSKYGSQVAKEMRDSVAQEEKATYKTLEERVEHIYTTSETGEATIHDTGDTVSMDDATVVSIGKDGMTVRVDGKEVSTDEIDFADDNQSYLYAAVSKIENITPGAATAIIRGYDASSGLTVGEYLNGIDEAYTYGYHGYSQADLKAGQFTTKLTAEQVKNAYEIGKYVKEVKGSTKSDVIKRMRTALEAEVEKANAEGKEAPKAKGMTMTYNDGNGKVVAFDKAGVKLTAKQKAAPALAQVMHEMGLGTNFEFFKSYINEAGVRVFLDENGVEKRAYSGVYRMSDGTVRIDLNAYNGRGLTLNAMSHELTHFIQQWSTEKYEMLADFLIKTYEKTDMTMHERVLREQARLERVRGEEVPYNEAYDEVVANAMSKMLDDGKVMDRLNELKAVDMNLAQKLWEGLKNILNKFFNAYKNESALFHDAADLMEMKAEFEQMQQMWAEAFVEASENFQANLMTTEVGVEPVAVEDISQYSYSSLAEAAGFTAVENENGTRAFVRDGQAVSKVTIEDIENSPIGAFINFSLEMGDISEADAKKQKKMFADICTMACKTNDFAMTMQFVGSAVFTGMKANADKQYGTTYDFPSICTKTQAVIDAMSAKMVSLGRGLNTNEIVQLYNDVFASGNPVPCPECYVFSRWIGIGGLLDNIKKYQDYYGGMAVEDVADAYRKMKAEVSKFADEQGISFGKAKGALTSKLTKEFNKLNEKIEKAQNQGEKVKPADLKRLEELEPMMNTVKSMTWLENVYFADSSLKKVNPNFRVPDSVLFDLNNGETFATQYKDAWAFRTTQGAGYGKAITPYAEARLGEGVLVTNNTTNAIKGKAQGSLNNYFLNQMGKLDKQSRDALKRARLKQKIQAFIGGQRFQSTSDARYENASDYLLAALEMQAMAGMVQCYTKVDGAVPAFSAWGFSINQSLMPLNGGLDADGNVKDTSVGGMKPSVAFENRKNHESAGTITIGVNDNHIRAMFKQLVRDFIIPYHASGGKADVVAEFRRIQEGKEAKGKAVRSTDYSRTQSDKVLSDEVLNWQGKTDAQIQRIHEIRNARIAILTGGKPNMTVVRSNRFLSALYDKLNGGEWDGVKLAKSKVESQIFPNEFWDQTVTYEESAKITKDYLEYCEDLGFLHRFSGMVPSNGKLVPVNGYNENGERVQLTDLAYQYDENGNKTDKVEDFFWKVLTDRRMYDNNGNYLAQKVVTLNDTTTETVTGFAKNNQGREYDKAKAEALAQKIVKEHSGDKFSLHDPVESTNDLLAFHNISEKLLWDALKQKGLVMPSLAVTNKGLDAFGEISLLFDKSVIDPAVNKDNKLYGADAWTPMQTTLKMNAKFDTNKTVNAVNTMKDHIGNKYVSELLNITPKQFKEAIIKADGNIYEAYAHNIGVQTAYAMEKGIISQIPINKYGTVNQEMLQKQLDKTLDTDEGWRQYRRWLNNISDTVITSYDQATNEDVLRHMKSQPATAKSFKLSETGELVVPAVEYSSIKELRRNKNRLSENAEEATKAVASEFLAFAQKIGDTQQVVEAINAGFEGRYNIADIMKSFSNKGIKISSKEAGELQALYKKAVELPTQYFEAKPGGEIGLDKVNTAVVPDNVSAELRQALEEQGINVIEYKQGVKADRTKAVNSVKDLMFSSQETDIDNDFDYSELKWARELGIITAKDAAVFERTINNEIFRGAKPQSANGEYIVDTGRCLMFTDGDFHRPTLSRVVEFVTEYESLTADAKEMITNEAKVTGDIQESIATIEEMFGQGFVNLRNSPADTSYGRQARGRKGSNRSGTAQKAKSLKESLAEEGLSHLLEDDEVFSSQETDLDSDGKQLTKEQAEFFQDSVVRDADGRLMVMYHGTANGGAFTVFDGDKLGNRTLTSQIGQGFYFTNVKKEAESYMKNVDIYGRVSNGKNPNLHQVYLNITNPFDVNADTLDIDKVKSVYMDGTSDHFFDSFIAHYLNNKTVNGRVFTKAEVQGMSKADRVSLYVDYLAQIGTKELLSNMVQAFKFNAQSQLLASMKNRLGYDGIVEEFKPGQYQYVAFSSEQIKNVDNTAPTTDPDIRYSTHETDYSNRSLLANAFEGITKSSIEYEMIQEYKSHIKDLNALDKELGKINAEIREIRFTKGKYDAKKLSALESKATAIANEITRHDRELLSLEASEPLRKVIQRERKKEAQKTKAHVQEIQQNKKVRAEQTELRHKIRKTIRDLDKILNRGNKKQNVKEDMRGFASKALELADYLFTDHISNDDLIRKGITVRMTPKEAALVKETEDILSKLYDHADSLTDEEFTRLDDKRKANEEKLRDLLKAQRNEVQKTPVYNLFNDLVTEYASFKNSKQDAVKAAYDAEVERFLRSYIGESNGETDSDRKTLLQNMRVLDMTTEELWKLHNAYKMVLHSIRKANELHVKGKAESIESVVSQIVMDFGSRKIPEKKAAIALQKLTNKIGWDYEKLYYALDRIGSEAFTELIMNIANSENIVMQDVIEAAEFRDQVVEKHGFNNWDVNKKIDREFMDNTGKKFTMTLGQLMSLYAYSRRAGAWEHIEYGGFVFGEKALTDPKPANSYKLSKEQCEAITSLLTKEQKAYVEDMQKYLSETMGEKGNEVSMELYGIKMFGEKNYFPIHVAGQYKAQANESQAKAAQGFTSQTNAGFTHAQNPNAKAPFVLEGFNEIWADHVNEMSRYHGTVPALEDLRRVMNRSSYSESVAESTSVKAVMENHFGEEAVQYFDSLYREANSGAIQDKLQNKQKKLLSLFRKNSVAYSLSVVIQQPSAMSRAYAMIDKKYFGFKGMGALAFGVAKAVSSKWNPAYANAYNEMKKYAPGVTMAKEIGGFDTHTGSSIREYLLDTKKSFKQSMQTENLKGKAKAALDLVDNNAIANLPTVADKIAWIEIWNACKREAVAKNRDLAPNSEEFMQAVGERFTEVIRATQVYDSMFSKSPMLRSKNLAVQYLVSFMNEPNTTANMVEKAVRDATKGDWKSGVRTAVAVTSSIIFNNVLKAVIYAMRDDDEDETYIEKYAEAVVGGMIADFNPLSYIPYVRDVVSKLQGYDVERPDMAIVTDAIEAYQAIVKNANKDTENLTEYQLAELDKKVTDASWKLVGSLAAFFGIPVKNIYREVKGVLDHVRIASANAGMTTPSSVWDKVTASIPFLESETAKADKLYEAILSGDKAYIDRLKAGCVDKNGNFDQGKYDSAVVKALRENDPRIKAAAQAGVNGNAGERNRIFKEIKAEGKFSASYIIDAINSEANAIRNDAKPDKVAGQYEAYDFVEAVSAGDANTAKAVREDIISTYVANGKTQTEAEKAFVSDVESSVNEAYSYGTITKATAEKMLIDYADMEAEDAADKITYWDFCKTNPNCDLSESTVLDYLEFAEPAHVSLEVYEQFINDTADLKDIKDKWGDVEVTKREQVLEVIDSLPLSWQQKDALYLAYGYKESTIWDVPW